MCSLPAGTSAAATGGEGGLQGEASGLELPSAKFSKVSESVGGSLPGTSGEVSSAVRAWQDALTEDCVFVW